MQQWFDEYSISHQNEINRTIHFICVPVIYFSIAGLLMSINTSFLQKIMALDNPFIENWATVLSIFILAFYLRLSFTVFLKMFAFTAFSIVANYYLSTVTNLLYFSITIFTIAWIGQFFGHKEEGKKPSFYKDLQFLLIGPAWVFKELFQNKKD